MGGEDKHVTFSAEPEASPGPKIKRQPTGLPSTYPDDDEPKTGKGGVASSTESLEVSPVAVVSAPMNPPSSVHSRRVPQISPLRNGPHDASSHTSPNPTSLTSTFHPHTRRPCLGT